jgi:hypothetical protein
MKIAFLVTALPLWLVVAVDGQTQSQRQGDRGTLMSAGEDAYHARLKLTTRITVPMVESAIRFCSSSPMWETKPSYLIGRVRKWLDT